MKGIVTRHILLLLFVLTIVSCKQNTKKQKTITPEIIEISSPVDKGGEPNLFVSETGKVYLSWVAYVNDSTHALMFSTLEDSTWDTPKTIASGINWFVNWADFPSMVVSNNDQYLAAHWLQMRDTGTYDYDVRIAQSMDGGNTWSESFTPHTDSISAEHGFVSMLPISDKRMIATWLDGRNMKEDNDDSKPNSMTIRFAEFDGNNNLFHEAVLDNRTCECCDSDMVMTKNGPVVIYRDRSAAEIRDISIVRKVNGHWTAPKLITHDNWKIAGCPVNGPAVTSSDNTLAISWFTAANDTAKVNIIFSNDAGATFSKPIRIDDGSPLGRVDIVMLSNEKALVSWIENSDNDTHIMGAIITENGKQGDSFLLSKTNASRKSGFPILVKSSNRIILAWTDVQEDMTTVKTAELILDY